MIFHFQVSLPKCSWMYFLHLLASKQGQSWICRCISDGAVLNKQASYPRRSNCSNNSLTVLLGWMKSFHWAGWSIGAQFPHRKAIPGRSSLPAKLINNYSGYRLFRCRAGGQTSTVPSSWSINQGHQALSMAIQVINKQERNGSSTKWYWTIIGSTHNHQYSSLSLTHPC